MIFIFIILSMFVYIMYFYDSYRKKMGKYEKLEIIGDIALGTVC